MKILFLTKIPTAMAPKRHRLILKRSIWHLTGANQRLPAPTRRDLTIWHLRASAQVAESVELSMTTYMERAEKQKISDQRAAAIRLKNNRLGMNIFQVSWIMAFVALIVVNWQLRFSYSQWPPAGVPPFDLVLPSVATLALLTSSVLVVQALKALRRGFAHEHFLSSGGWRLGWGPCSWLIIVYEFLNVSDAAMATQYGNTFRLMTGFHFVHALAILAIMCRVYQVGEPRQIQWR